MDGTGDTSSVYFDSYNDIDVHELMLKDKPRTEAYMKFINENKEMFANKVVMDVGAGTGILSLFAAKAGAKKVYAVESSNLSQICDAIAVHNGYADIIEVKHSRVEDAVFTEKVDILISEWMGFYLLHESMITSIIFARDQWLKPGGIILPTTASLYICPVTMKDYHQQHIQYWTNVYGFDFFPVVAAVKSKLLSEPKILHVNAEECLSEPALVTHIDMQYVAEEDITRIPGHFAFNMSKHGVMHGFACWFDVKFDGASPITLDTSPSSAMTHWKQTVMFLPDSLLVNRDEEVACSLELKQNTQNRRRYDIVIGIRDDTLDSDDAETSPQDSPCNDDNTDVIKDMLFKAMSQNRH